MASDWAGSGRGSGSSAGFRAPVIVVALGNLDRGDDGAALVAARRLEAELEELRSPDPGVARATEGRSPSVEVVSAGRPGPDLLGFLAPDRPCVLLDVTWSGAPPGTLHRIPLPELVPGLLPDLRVSSHGFGFGEALSLARALGRSMPPGVFLGIEGESYGVGRSLSPPVEAGVERLVREVRMLVEQWAG